MILKNSKGIKAMTKHILTILLIAATVTLSSCGGGGGGAAGGNPANNQADSLSIVATPGVASLPANTLGYPIFSGSPFETQVDVRVTFGNGQGVATGTIVHMQTNNTAVAVVGIPDDPTTDDENERGIDFVGANQETIGSIASYFIRSNGVGTATFTVNATHPTNGRNFSTTFNFTVTEGPDPTVQQLTAVTSRNTLPVNSENTPFFNGTPFMMEVDLQVKDVFGNFIEPILLGTTSGSAGRPVVKVSINPTNVLYLTKNDDVGTLNINEFLTEVTPGEININAGHGNLFLWSKNVPGTATISLSTFDNFGVEISSSFQVEVTSGIDIGIPTDIELASNSNSLYINGSGGATSQTLNYTIKSGEFNVQDTQVNNLQISLTTDIANSGERLSAVDAHGNSVSGTTIQTSSVNGIANALLHSGSDPLTITLTSTVDGSDNNVENGIQTPISRTDSYIVSDGVLWALELTSPALDALTVNGELVLDDEGNPELDNGLVQYNFQDGTYSLIISAIGTDKAGNPALPQTVQFGMINSPITGYPLSGSGVFVHSSNDGDPQEGGTGFSSVTGAFLTAAGGVQPADTLVVFGEESLGNEDLESALTVSNINSQTSLSIIERFNRNDETGTINNDFGILPYAIGRAVDGNITATATLDANGVATTRLNYPVSQLGRLAAVFVKGQGGNNNGIVKSVTDVELTTFSGVEGFQGNRSNLIVSPNIIPGNVTNSFIVCLADSARNPLPGRYVRFSYQGVGIGTIDGQSGSGVMNTATGFDGCTTGIASTTGVVPGTSNDESGFSFSSGSLTCRSEDGSLLDVCLQVNATADGVLNATPSAFSTSGQKTIILTLFDGSGNRIEGAAIQGECMSSGGSLGIISGPSITDSNGESIVVVLAALDEANATNDGTCSFSTASGMPSVDVNFSGRDICDFNVSPTPPGCVGTAQFQVGGMVTGMVTAGPIVLQNNNSGDISLSSNTTFLFPLQDEGTVYLISVKTQPPGQTCTVTNGAGTLSSNVTNVAVTCI